MPSELDMCIIDLCAKGTARDKAMRACVVAQHSKGSKMKNRPMSEVAMEIAASSSEFSQRESMNNDHAVLANSSPSFVLDPTLKDAIFPFDENPSCPVLIRECLMVKAGTFNGLEITKKNLQEFADNFNSPIPIIYDHIMSIKGGCAGWILSVRVDGDKLFGLGEFIGEEVVSLIQTRRLKKTSIGFYYGSMWKINEYSFVVNPAVEDSGIMPVKMSADEQNSQTFTLSHSPSQQVNQGTTYPLASSQLLALLSDQPERKEIPNMPTLPTPDPVAAPVKELAAEPTPVSVVVPVKAEIQFSEDQKAIFAQIQEQQAKMAADMAILQTANAKLMADNEAMSLAAKQKATVDLWLSFASRGESLPIVKDEELALLSTFNDDQINKYKALKEKQGSLIGYGRLSSPATAGTTGGTDKQSAAYTKDKEEMEKAMVKQFGLAFKKSSEKGKE